MNAATKTIYCKMAQSWWKADGAAVGAYYWGTGSGPAWPGVRMTPVSGETDLWSIDIDTDKFQNIIFTRVNGSGTVSDWGAKTADLTVPTDDKNLYTITSTSPVWGSPGVAGNWSVYAPDAPKTYKDITITIVANATPKIHYWEGGDKVVGTEWDAKPEMVATGEENTYSYTIKDVDEATGVKYLVVVGEVQSADQQAFEDVNKNFKELLPQVAVMGVTSWDGDKMTVADDYLSASVTLTLEAAKDYELKLTVNGEWFGSNAITITKDNNSASFAENGDGNGKLTTDLAGDYVFTYTYATKTLVVTYPAPVEEEINYETFTMSNLAVTPMGDFDLLEASDDMMGLSVTLGVYADGSLHPASAVLFNGEELTIVEGNVTKAYNDEVAADVYTARLVVEFMGGKLGLELLMYAGASASEIEVAIEGAEVEVVEATGTLQFTATWTDSTTMVTYPVLVTVAGYEEAEFKEYEGAQISELTIGDDDNWFDFAVADAVAVFKDGNAFALEGEYTSWATGTTYYVAIEGELPVVVEPDPVKPEPTYTENNLNPYAFGLESELSADQSVLTVTYRLNNSNATEVNVVVYNGEDIVALVPGTTTIGVNTVEVATGDLPTGVELKWAVEVKGTSVDAPTREEKIYSFYHPSGVDIDINPENETFGLLLVNEGMQSVASMTEGYVSAGFGAGIFAFTPSFDLVANGELPGYNGGIEFTNTRADGAGTAYAPRRIRISEDGRIFVTSLNTDGNYLWEVDPNNFNEWTPIFKGTLNDQRELITEDSAFIAAPNNGFDVKGSGENLQLAMYSVNLSGITAAAMSGFRLHEYNLGTATEWATAPTKTLVEGKYAINYTGTQVEYDNEGGFWIASYRGSATDANPGLVHINAEGVEDCKLVWNNVRQAGIRFNKDFTKLVVAGNNGAAKKATIYTISKDANGAPVLTEEAVVDMSVVGNNLNDFAWDYAGNLYSCGNSSEKLAAWAMPYSGTVETPAAAQYAFQLPEPMKMAGVVKRAVQNGDEVIVLTHEADGTAHIYQVVDGKAVAELSQEGVIAVDPENAGDYLAISDIAVTEDGKLVATNYMQTQSGDDYVDAGYKRGETRIYIWNDLAGDPAILFTSKMSSNWFRSKQGLTMAVKGTSDNMEIFMTGIHATKAWARASSYRVINGVYEEPAVNHNDHYYFYDINDAIALETTVGTQYELNASPLGEMNWVLDAELINPTEIVESATNNVEIATSVALTEDLGKKYNGASYVTVGEKVLMVAPFANPDGELVGAEILNITNGFDAPQYVDMVYVDEAVAATTAATAVEVVEGGLNITLVADATIHTWFVEMSEGSEWEVYEDEITNLVIDLDNLVLIGGPSSAFQVDVYLGLGDYNRNDDTYQLLPESSVALFGTDATFVEGYAYEVDAFTPSAKAVVRCVWNGMNIELHLTMTAEPMEATVVVVENAAIEIEKYLLFGDMYDYALKMTGEWVNPEDGLTYPVLVEVPVYYPEATEPSEIMSTVTVGGWDDNDPWLGFGEGTLTVTTETLSGGDKLITATGIVQNPMAGVAIDITISGTIIATSLEDATVTVKPVKMIQNGQLIIKKGDVQYNAQGATLK